MNSSDKKFNVLGFIKTNDLANHSDFQGRFKSYQKGDYGKGTLGSFLESNFNISEKNARAVIDEYNFQNPRQNIPYIPVQGQENIDPKLIERIRKKETYPEFLWPYFYPKLRDVQLEAPLHVIRSMFAMGEQSRAINELAKFLTRSLDFITTDSKKKDKKDILYFDSKIWNYGGKILLERILEKTIPNATSYQVRECIDKIRRLTPFHKTNERLNNPRYLTFQNIVLDRKTLEFIPFNKKYYTTFSLPSIYVTETDDPKLKEVCEILVGKDKVHVIQELFGFCLDMGYGIKEFLVLIGETDTGKTTLLGILSKFLGNRVNGASIQQLTEERFSVADLKDNLANICGDIPTKTILDSSFIKKATSEDLLNAEKKGEHPFNFINSCKLIFSCNNFPHARDDSEAYINRLVFLDFIRHFTEKEKEKKGRKEVITESTTPEELSKILNWAIEGLKNLRKRKSFLSIEEKKNRRGNYEAKTQPINSQIEGNYIFDEGLWTFNQDLYDGHVLHCKKYNIEAMSRNGYIKKVKWYYKGRIKDSNRPDPNNGGKITRCLVNIGLKGSEKEDEVIAEIGEMYE